MGKCYRWWCCCFFGDDFCGERLRDFFVFGPLLSDPSSERLAGNVEDSSCGDRRFLWERVSGLACSSGMLCSTLAVLSVRLSSWLSGIVGNEDGGASSLSRVVARSGMGIAGERTTVSGFALSAAKPVVASSTVIVSMSSRIADSSGCSTTSGSVER